MRAKLKAGIGFVIVSLFICQFAAAETSRQAEIAKAEGEVNVKLAGEDWKPAEPGMILGEQDELRTSEDSSAELLLDNGDVGKVEVREKSYFKVHTMNMDPETGDKTTLLDLAMGKVLIHAGKLQGESKFEVRTPTATTGVRGTVFEVSVEEKKK